MSDTDYGNGDPGDPVDLPRQMEQKHCVHAVSKDVSGTIVLDLADRQECEDPPCETLKHQLTVDLALVPGPCDSAEAAGLDGPLTGSMVTAYGDNDLYGRGGHTGSVTFGTASVASGSMRGISNAGTVRAPLDACEACDDNPRMKGWLDATIDSGDHQGCRIVALYDLGAYDPSGGDYIGIVGTVEGIILCHCA